MTTTSGRTNGGSALDISAWISVSVTDVVAVAAVVVTTLALGPAIWQAYMATRQAKAAEAQIDNVRTETAGALETGRRDAPHALDGAAEDLISAIEAYAAALTSPFPVPIAVHERLERAKSAFDEYEVTSAQHRPARLAAHHAFARSVDAWWSVASGHGGDIGPVSDARLTEATARVRTDGQSLHNALR